MLTKIFLELTRPALPAPAGDAPPEWRAPAAPWSGSRDPYLPPARTQQDKLELMQWVAFACMVADHLGFFGPILWGSEPFALRLIGRLAYPLFSLVFAWRVAHITWRNAQHDFTGQFFRLMVCAMAAQIAWGLTGADVPINPVMGFGAAMAIIVLLQEDRNGYIQNIPLGLRMVMCTLIGMWVHSNVDYGMTGLLMTLAAYSSIRFADEMAKVAGCLCLFVLTASFHIHGAFIALPVAWLILNGEAGIKRPIPGLFYWLYPVHILAFALILHLGISTS
jgi:TraX protein